MKQTIKLGATSRTVTVFIPDPASTDGSGKTGLVAANLTVSYTRVETDNDVIVTDVTSSLTDLSALTDAYAAWGLKEVSNTLAPGLYRLDIADAVFATGAWSAVVYVMITTSAAAASPMEFILVAVDDLDTVRMGLTALPNAAAAASGGLMILGSNNTAAITIGALTTGAIACTTITASGAVAFQSTFAVTTSTALGALSCTTLTASGAVAFQTTFAVTTSTALAALSATTITASGTTSLAAVTTSGTVTLNALTVTNNLLVSGNSTVTGTTTHTGNVSLAAGLTIAQSTLNGNAITLTGNGTGDGIHSVGGTTGHGIHSLGGATSGFGLRCEAVGANQSGAYLTGLGDGHGLQLNGGTAGAGMYAEGGTAGDGIACQGHGVGGGIVSHGGDTAGPGFYVHGGLTGPGAQFEGGDTSGSGIDIVTHDGHGIFSDAFGTDRHACILSANGTGSIGLNVGGIMAGMYLYADNASVPNYSGALVMESGVGDVVSVTADAAGNCMTLLTGIGDGIHIQASNTAINAIGDINGILGQGASGAGIFGQGTGTGSYGARFAGGDGTHAAIGMSIEGNDSSCLNIFGAGDCIGVNVDTTDGDQDAISIAAGDSAGVSISNASTRATVLMGNSLGDVVKAIATGGNGIAFRGIGDGSGTGFSSVPDAVGFGTGGGGPTAAQIATAVWQDTTSGDFTVSGSIGKSLFTSGAVPGAAGGLFIAGTNAATVVTTSFTTTFTGNLTGSVGSVSGAVGSVTGNVGGNVAGTVASVVGAVGSVTGNVGGNVVGSVASVAGAVGSVTGNVGGNVVGSVGSVTGLTTATITTAVLTTQMTESYSADGAAPTLTQAVMLTQQTLTEIGFVGTTGTIKKVDGSTTAATLTINDATTPTSITRAT